MSSGTPLALPAAMLHTFQIPITWGELIKRTYNEINKDNVLGLAAQLAYYFLLGLVPAIVCVLGIALVGFRHGKTQIRVGYSLKMVSLAG